MRTTILLILASVLVAGCSPTAAPPPAPPPAAPTSSAEAVTSTAGAFMGVPEDEGADPVHGPGGIIYKISPVREAEYADYLRAMNEGKIVEERRCGRYQYYAVHSHLDVWLPNPKQGDPISAWIIITERYKAEIPSGE